VNFNDQKFNAEDLKFIKKIIEHTLKFWGDCYRDIDDFPWDLYKGTEDGEVIEKGLKDSEKETLKKLKEAGIETFDVENIENVENNS